MNRSYRRTDSDPFDAGQQRANPRGAPTEDADLFQENFETFESLFERRRRPPMDYDLQKVHLKSPGRRAKKSSAATGFDTPVKRKVTKSNSLTKQRTSRIIDTRGPGGKREPEPRSHSSNCPTLTIPETPTRTLQRTKSQSSSKSQSSGSSNGSCERTATTRSCSTRASTIVSPGTPTPKRLGSPRRRRSSRRSSKTDETGRDIAAPRRKLGSGLPDIPLINVERPKLNDAEQSLLFSDASQTANESSVGPGRGFESALDSRGSRSSERKSRSKSAKKRHSRKKSFEQPFVPPSIPQGEAFGGEFEVRQPGQVSTQQAEHSFEEMFQCHDPPTPQLEEAYLSNEGLPVSHPSQEGDPASNSHLMQVLATMQARIKTLEAEAQVNPKKLKRRESSGTSRRLSTRNQPSQEPSSRRKAANSRNNQKRTGERRSSTRVQSTPKQVVASAYFARPEPLQSSFDRIQAQEVDDNIDNSIADQSFSDLIVWKRRF